MLSNFRKSLVFDVLRFQHLEKSIAEQVGVFTVIETKPGAPGSCPSFAR